MSAMLATGITRRRKVIVIPLNSFLVFLLLLLQFRASICSAKNSNNSNNLVATTTATTSCRTKTSAAAEGFKNALASGLAAACCKIILAPFDTLKTVQQQSREGSTFTMAKAFRTVLQRPGGVFNLYAGLDVAVVGSMPSVGLYFGVYSYCKRRLQPMLQSRMGEEQAGLARTLAVATSAAVGNAVASASRVPYEVVKQKLQAGDYSSTLQALSQMLKQPNPWQAFFPSNGIRSQMFRDIPYAIFTLLSYEYIREKWASKQPQQAWRDMVCGGVAGGIGSYLTNPMDVIKTRLQTASVVGANENINNSIMECALHLWTEEGAMSFWKGSVPRLLHKIPANAIFFLCYEFFRKTLSVESQEKDKV